MLLSEGQARAVDSARKTRHTLPAKRPWRLQLRIGIRDRYGVICHVETTDVQHDVPLTVPTRQHAALEGYAGVRGPINMQRAWLEAYDKGWVRKAEDTDMGVTDEAVAQRFAGRWVGVPVHVLTWRLVESPLVFLAAGSRGGDYTANPARALDSDAPCPPREFVEAEAKKAEARRQTQAASFRHDLEAERARRKGINPEGLSNRALRQINDAAERRAA